MPILTGIGYIDVFPIHNYKIEITYFNSVKEVVEIETRGKLQLNGKSCLKTRDKPGYIRCNVQSFKIISND